MFHLFEESANILPQDAQAEQVDRRQRQNGKDERGPADRVAWIEAEDGPVGQILDDDKHGDKQAKYGENQPHRKNELERTVAEVDDAIGSQLEQPAEVV